MHPREKEICFVNSSMRGYDSLHTMINTTAGWVFDGYFSLYKALHKNIQNLVNFY